MEETEVYPHVVWVSRDASAVSSSFETLPEYKGASCWKCRGSGVDPRRTMTCGICAGKGELYNAYLTTSTAKVSKGREDAPGPSPVCGDEPGPGEALCCLCGKWRIFQRVRGHRYSTEDVVTAWVAATELHGKRCHIDLGTGVASVLLLVAWRARDRELASVGIEAQADSYRLASRSVAYNGAPCRVILGDIRTTAVRVAGPVLVTGTPPYYNIRSGQTNVGALPKCEQSAGARYEFRGGIEIYCEAAARILRQHPENSRFVCCEGGLQLNLQRVHEAARAHDLRILSHHLVIGKHGKPPLFGVWIFQLNINSQGDAPAPLPPPNPIVLTVRDPRGFHTAEYSALLADMGMPASLPQNNST